MSLCKRRTKQPITAKASNPNNTRTQKQRLWPGGLSEQLKKIDLKIKKKIVQKKVKQQKTDKSSLKVQYNKISKCKTTEQKTYKI